MKGYKAFNSDLTCRGFQYKIGGIYEMKESPIICKRGFHFCTNIANCYQFYDMDDDVRICEVEAIGDIVGDGETKYCTNKIRIIKEITDGRRKANVVNNSSGYCNSGTKNSGNCNSGYYNSGNSNTGSRNSGSYNSGTHNFGHWNSGNFNSGNGNSGDWNSGVNNSGNWNFGSWNSGDWNIGNRNSGVFNTELQPTIKMFDKNTTWTHRRWYCSVAYEIMRTCPNTHSIFVNEDDMTDDEKFYHPEYKIIGGYVEDITVTIEDRQEWWDNLSSSDKETIKALPNFDADKFCACVGIYHI